MLSSHLTKLALRYKVVKLFLQTLYIHASSTSLHENFEMYTYSLLVGLNFPLCCTMLKFVILTTLHNYD